MPAGALSVKQNRDMRDHGGASQQISRLWRREEKVTGVSRENDA
jgi:hypothetical protein